MRVDNLLEIPYTRVYETNFMPDAPLLSTYILVNNGHIQKEWMGKSCAHGASGYAFLGLLPSQVTSSFTRTFAKIQLHLSLAVVMEPLCLRICGTFDALDLQVKWSYNSIYSW